MKCVGHQRRQELHRHLLVGIHHGRRVQQVFDLPAAQVCLDGHDRGADGGSALLLGIGERYVEQPQTLQTHGDAFGKPAKIVVDL